MKNIKCYIFYRIARLLGKLIKDQAAQEEFYELCSELWAQEGLF